MIIRSDWRGEPRKNSAPKLEISYRDAPIEIISIAQHAKPKDIGQIELRRAQFTTLSSDANRIPSSLRKLSSSPGLSSVTPFASSTAIGMDSSFSQHFACLERNLQRAFRDDS